MSLQIELLEQSFNYIKPYGNLFVSSFYETLFKTNSEIKSLFIGIDLEISKNQVWDSLVLVVENLRQPKILKNILQGLGARLFTYGVSPEHYPLARNALLNTFKQFLGGEWNAEFEQAWKDAYVDFRELMLEGAEQTREQIARKTTSKDLSETLISERESQLPETLSPKSQSTSTATATKVESVASTKKSEPESQSRKSNKKLLIGLIGGCVTGVIGVLLFLILL